MVEKWFFGNRWLNLAAIAVWLAAFLYLGIFNQYMPTLEAKLIEGGMIATVIVAVLFVIPYLIWAGIMRLDKKYRREEPT